MIKYEVICVFESGSIVSNVVEAPNKKIAAIKCLQQLAALQQGLVSLTVVYSG